MCYFPKLRTFGAYYAPKKFCFISSTQIQPAYTI